VIYKCPVYFKFILAPSLFLCRFGILDNKNAKTQKEVILKNIKAVG
jgi:hypothetical protein